MAHNGGSVVLSPNGEFDGDAPDVAVVVFGENPYAEGDGDRNHLSYSALDPQPLAILRRMKERGIPTVSIFLTGRPLWVNPELNASDAFVVAWLPGTEGAGVAEVLTRATLHMDYPHSTEPAATAPPILVAPSQPNRTIDTPS